MFRRTLGGNTDLWSIEASRNVLRRLTFDPARDYDAVWSPGGDRIVFNSDRKGVLDLYETSLSGGSASAATLLLETSEHKNVTDWSADGRFILYTVQSPTTGNDIWVLPLVGDRTPIPVAQTAAGESCAALLARWPMGGLLNPTKAAGAKSTCRRFQTRLGRCRFRQPAASAPVWRGDGAELFFRSPDDQLMAARIASSGTRARHGHAIGPVRAATRPESCGAAVQPWYDASRDGQRFLVNTFVEGASPITVLLNWKPGN